MSFMALKLFPFQFPIFGPNINPNPSNRPATELRFARWNNANAEKFNQRKREQQEIEDDIRRTRRFESAINIIDNYETATPSTSTNTVTFKSTGTPSSPSKPSIPGLKSKYSKRVSRVSHPAFRRVHKITKLPLPLQTDGEKTEIDRRAEVSVSEDGVSYAIDGAPFEFKYSYTETPALKPVKLREPPFSPFGPTTMGRPWTGKAPLPPSKKKVREFDSFVLPPPNKKGVKTVQAPGPFRPGSGPKYVRTREEVLGEPLTKEEVKELINSCVRSNRQLNMGRDGFTHNMLENIHAHWKRRRVCKIKCKGVCTVDMDNVCQQLEERTGGKIIFRKGGVLYLFRGRNYNYKTRPKFPLMLWRPVTPVYPRLIQRVPDGLTLEEANNMRKKGRDLIPICKLAKNGVYCNLVKLVREAFEACELVRINCRGVNGSDYRKIGAKLRDLVPCVLISFEGEHILMWRGKNWKSSFLIPVNKSEEVETSTASDQSLMAEHPSDDQDQDSELVSNNNESLGDLDIGTRLESSDEEAENLSTVEIEQPYVLRDSSSTSSETCRRTAMLDSVGVNYAVNECEDEDSRFSAEATLENPGYAAEMSSTASVESGFLRDGADRTKENQDAVEGDNHCSDQVKLNSPSVEVLLQLMKQAVEHGSAVIISDEMDDDSIYQRAVAFAKSAPPGPVFKRRSREKTSVQKLENSETKSSVAKDVSSNTTQGDRKERRSSKLERELDSVKQYLDAAPKGKLGVDELAKLLA